MSGQVMYINPPQAKAREAYMGNLAPDRIYTNVWGRGTGKSFLLGDFSSAAMDLMPGSTGFICGPTDEAIRNRILPSARAAWTNLGFEEDTDYVIGKRPPKHFGKPLSPPDSWKNVICWWNGSIAVLVSLYRADAARGLSGQWAATDEAAWVKQEHYEPNVVPAIRGFSFQQAVHEIDEPAEFAWGEVVKKGRRHFWRYRFRECPLYGAQLFVTSRPVLTIGKWIEHMEEKPGVCYSEANAYDNLDVLGPGYISRMQASMTDEVFRIEILNEKFNANAEGFYPAFNDAVHVVFHNHYHTNTALDLSFDFGKFTGLVIGQHVPGYLHTIDTKYRKDGDLEGLVHEFISDYRHHQERIVYLTGDVNGLYTKNNQTTQIPMYQQIEDILRANDWRVIRTVGTTNPTHAEKHHAIRRGMEQREKGKQPACTFYAEKCMPLIISIKQAGMRDDFRKDKRSEHPDHPTPQEHATHLSDAWDYLYISRAGSVPSSSGSGSLPMIG